MKGKWKVGREEKQWGGRN